MSKVPPRDVLNKLLADAMRQQAATLEDRHFDKPVSNIEETRTLLHDWAEALETDTTLQEVQRRRLRREGKPLLRVVG